MVSKYMMRICDEKNRMGRNIKSSRNENNTVQLFDIIPDNNKK